MFSSYQFFSSYRRSKLTLLLSYYPFFYQSSTRSILLSLLLTCLKPFHTSNLTLLRSYTWPRTSLFLSLSNQHFIVYCWLTYLNSNSPQNSQIVLNDHPTCSLISLLPISSPTHSFLPAFQPHSHFSPLLTFLLTYLPFFSYSYRTVLVKALYEKQAKRNVKNK